VQFTLGNHPWRPIEQRDQQLKGLGRQMDVCAVAPQAGIMRTADLAHATRIEQFAYSEAVES
jgi:hypothetical protein